MGDYTYRTRDEVELWKTRCPIQRLRRLLVEESLAGEPELEAIDEEVESQILDAVQSAESSAWPNPATAADHLYAVPADDDRRVPVRNTPPKSAPRAHFHEATLRRPEMAKNPGSS
jgi:2-oxoisovalerate dehydrogenase E1 component